MLRRPYFGLPALMCDSWQGGLVHVGQRSLSGSLPVPHQHLKNHEGATDKEQASTLQFQILPES
jgi:hypothetical protein